MKRRFLRVLAGLTIPAFCLLMSPKVWAAGASAAGDRAPELVVTLSMPDGTPQSDLSPGEMAADFTLSAPANVPLSGPAEARLAPSRDLLERSERLWGRRVNRGIVKDTLFLYTVEVDGDTVLDRVGSGCIEENYYVRIPDLSDISVSSRSRRAPDWKTPEEAELAKPVGEGANLRLRGYLVKKDIKLYLCREITVTDKDGNVVYYDLDQQPATKDEHYSFRVSTTGGKHAPDASEPDVAADGSQMLEREWTYVSSDGRALWRVDLQGHFQNGLCTDASGSAESLSDNWRTEDADFLAIDTDAVARVTVSRWVLGFAVARESYEFHLSPQ